jgi:hypothetical protein
MRSGGGVEHDRDDWISPPRQMVLQRGLHGLTEGIALGQVVLH